MNYYLLIYVLNLQEVLLLFDIKHKTEKTLSMSAVQFGMQIGHLVKHLAILVYYPYVSKDTNYIFKF